MAELFAVLLILAAVQLGVRGFSELNEATYGIGLLASACLLGILGRIAQADAYHRQAQRKADERERQTRELLQWIYTAHIGHELKRKILTPGTKVRINARALDKKNKRVRLQAEPHPESQEVFVLSHGAHAIVLQDSGEEYLQLETPGGNYRGWLDFRYVQMW